MQPLSDRRRSLQQILRRRRPATTTAINRVRSVRQNVKGVTSLPSVAIGSFVEDSEDSLPPLSVQRRAQTVSEEVLAKSVVADTCDVEEDRYNLLESTEELEVELPCRYESVNEMAVCGELDGDVTIVSEMSHAVTDVSANVVAAVHDQSAVADNQPTTAAHSSCQPPLPLPPPPPRMSSESAVSEEDGVQQRRTHRLSSLPTQQLDGQIDTPATTTARRQQSSVVDKVGIICPCIVIIHLVCEKRISDIFFLYLH